jgi:hypothetical protein
MSFEPSEFEMGKRDRERGKGGGGLLYPPHTEKSHYSSKTRNVRENPETPGSPETPGKTWILRPSKVSTQENIHVNVLVQRCLS